MVSTVLPFCEGIILDLVIEHYWYRDPRDYD